MNKRNKKQKEKRKKVKLSDSFVVTFYNLDKPEEKVRLLYSKKGFKKRKIRSKK